MTTRVLIAAGLVAALAGGSMAFAHTGQPGPRRPGIEQRRGPAGPGGQPGPRGFGGDLGLRGVQLTDAQREQVRTIMESHKAEFDQARTRMREAHRAFAEATAAQPLDESTVRARSADVANAMAEEAILRARVRAEVLTLLTPEQQEQITQRQPRRRQ